MPQISNGDRVIPSGRYALCVGIGRYTSPFIHKLRYATDDATIIAKRLEDPMRGSFAVTLLTEPNQTTKAALEEALDSLLSAPDRRAENLAVIYFSCHGEIYAQDNVFCLLPSDAELQADNKTYNLKTLYSIYDLAKLLSEARVQNIVVFLDACHSGGAGVALQHFNLNLRVGPNIFILGAARQDQVTTQSSMLEHGLFTHCLLRAFEQPPIKDGWLTISQIHSFVNEEINWVVTGHPIQIQAWSVTVNINLPLLRNPSFPELSPLPPIWNIPLQRNPFFTGQEDVLAQLVTMLHREQKTALTHPQSITGLGGIGKTQLALEYAYRHRQDYHAVLWCHADTRDALISAFVSIAYLLDLPQKDEEDQTVIIETVKAWLAGRSKWLLILDNADNLAIVKEFIPPAFQGHLLLTTRAQVTEGLAEKLDVKVMKPETGALLVLRRAGLVPLDALLEQATPEDREQAIQISQELGGLPLALDQAGAYLDATKVSLSAYQQIYNQHRAELFKERRGLVTGYPESVATTWSLSFRRVEQKDQAAAELLRLCAFFAPDAIPEEILTAGASVLGLLLEPVVADAFLLGKAIEVLRTYSLLERDPRANTISIHRLVQAVLQEEMGEEERRTWAKRAILAVNAVFPQAEYGTWPQCERLLTQALVATQGIEQYQVISEEAGRLLYRTASYLQDRARYSEAEPLYLRAIHIWEQALGLEHSQVASPLYGLAGLYANQGKYEAAEPLYHRAIRIWEQALGPDHLQVATPLNGLAALYYDQSKYEEAEPLLQRTIRIWEQALGPDHPQIAKSLNNLASLYWQQGKYGEAELLYQRAIHIREKALGSYHPQVAYPLTGLAMLYWQQGKYEEAEPLYRRAIYIWEQALGPDHPQIASPLNGLAVLYSKLGRYGEAELLCQRAIHIWEQVLGPEHPHIAMPLTNLATVYREQGRYEEAEPLYLRAVRIQEQTLSSDHPDVAHPLTNLATLYREQGRYEEAEPLYLRALYIQEHRLGQHHPETANTLCDFATFRYTQGQIIEAELLYQRALAIHEQSLGLYHPSTVETRKRYITLLRDIGRQDEAVLLEGIQAKRIKDT